GNFDVDVRDLHIRFIAEVLAQLVLEPAARVAGLPLEQVRRNHLLVERIFESVMAKKVAHTRDHSYGRLKACLLFAHFPQMSGDLFRHARSPLEGIPVPQAMSNHVDVCCECYLLHAQRICVCHQGQAVFACRRANLEQALHAEDRPVRGTAEAVLDEYLYAMCAACSNPAHDSLGSMPGSVGTGG